MDDMELRQLNTFRMVAHALNFSRAAIALNYVQSSVTTQIQALEEELGTRLFDRLGKRVVLTEAGERFLHYAEKILELVEEARSVVNEDEEVTGSVSISAPESLCTYLLPSVLQQFRVQYPRARVVFRPQPVTNERSSVSEGSVDIAFAIDEAMPSTSLIIENLVNTPLHLLASPDHPLASFTSLQSSQLQGELFLLTERGCGYRNMLERALNKEGIDMISQLEFSSVEAIKQCAMVGMGIAFLPEITVTTELAQGRLTVLSWSDHVFHAMTQMIWHREKWLSPAMQAFIAMTHEMLDAHLVPAMR
jgi:DNA-binding transcriptional LysR family regulator